MQFTLSTAALAAIAPFILPALAAPASSSTSLDLAAVTDAPAVPTNGKPDVAPEADVAANARGKANVRNHCGFPVYIYVCGQGHGSTPPSCTSITKVGAHTGTFSEQYIPFVNDGRSIKISPQNGEVAKPLLQFEYTPTASQVYYDLSNVNGNPFGKEGFTLTDSRGFSKHCAPNGACNWVFHGPTSGTVYNTAISDSIGVTLCG